MINVYISFINLFRNDIINPNSKTSDLKTLTAILNTSNQLQRYLFPHYPGVFFTHLLVNAYLLSKKDRNECVKYCDESLRMLHEVEAVGDVSESAFEALTYVVHINGNANVLDLLDRFCPGEEMKECTEIYRSFLDGPAGKLDERIRRLAERFGVTKPISTIAHYVTRELNGKFNDGRGVTLDEARVLMAAEEILWASEFSDRFSCMCPVNNKSQAVMSLNAIIKNLYLTLKAGSAYDETLDGIVYGCFERAVGRVESQRCDGKWSDYWRMIGITMYNTSLKLFQRGRHELCVRYFRALIRSIVSFEGVGDTNLCFDNSLAVSLDVIACSYLELKQYRLALELTAWGISVCPTMRKKLWNNWCNIKARATDEKLSALSVCDLLENEQTIRKFHPSYVFDPAVAEELLFSELEAYSKVWPSKVPMIVVARRLLKSCKDVVVRTRTFHVIWERTANLYDEELIKDLKRTMRMLEKNRSATNRVCLSVAHFVDYQFKMREMVRKNILDVRNIDVPENEPNTPSNLPVSPSNRVENVFQTVKILTKSLEIWEEMLRNPIGGAPVIDLDKYVKLAAFEYRLQGFTSEMLRCWSVYLSLGKIFNKPDVIVTGIGFIVEQCGVHGAEIRELIETAEEQAKSLTGNNEVLATYYINKSAGCFVSKAYDESLRNLSRAERFVRDTPAEQRKFFESRIGFLKSRGESKPCGSRITNHDENYLVLLKNAFKPIAEGYKASGAVSFALALLFEMVLSTAWTYKWLRMTREMHGCTSQVVLLAQQFVVPLRTAQLLHVSALADDLSRQHDACRVKLNEIGYVLCYSNAIADAKKTLDVCGNFEALSLLDHPIEVMLDVPKDHRDKMDQGSPVLLASSFKMPPFSLHDECDCFHCANIDYHRIVFDYLHLEAVYYLRQSNARSAMEFFKGAFRYYDRIEKKINVRPVFVEVFRRRLRYAYALFLASYSMYFDAFRKREQAEMLIDKIFEILADDLDEHDYFHAELLLHQVSFWMSKDRGSDFARVETPVAESLQTTPDNKMSVVDVPANVASILESLPIDKRLEKLRINIFKDDDDEDELPPKSVRKLPVRKTAKKPPSRNATKTESAKVQVVKLEAPSKSPVRTPESSPLDKKIETLNKRTMLLTSKLKAEAKVGKVPAKTLKGRNETAKAGFENIENEQIGKRTLRANQSEAEKMEASSSSSDSSQRRTRSRRDLK